MRKAMLFLAVLGLAGPLWAGEPWVGTWKVSAVGMGWPRIPSEAEGFSLTHPQHSYPGHPSLYRLLIGHP
jgi:hypothetical protein